MSADDLLPDQLAPTREAGVPTKTLVLVGGLTGLFAVYGSLTAITEFASLSFIVVFGAVSYLAYSRRADLVGAIPLVGLAGTLVFLPAFAWHLYTAQFDVFILVVAIAALLVVIEGLCFKREAVRAGLREIERGF